jgi:hypothetical protein
VPFWDDEPDGYRDTKRTLGIRDKQILYDRAKGRCENPACRKRILVIEMLPGHKKAWSKGGKTTLANSVCLCYACNKKQGTDSWAVFLKKQGYEDPKVKIKRGLETLSAKQLKCLADKHHIKVKGQVVDDWGGSYTVSPTKKQYITRLSGIVTVRELGSAVKTKQRLETLSIKQLKYLAARHRIKVTGQVVDDWWDGSYTIAPTKRQYITKLSGVLTARDFNSVPKEPPKVAKRKQKKTRAPAR